MKKLFLLCLLCLSFSLAAVEWPEAATDVYAKIRSVYVTAHGPVFVILDDREEIRFYTNGGDAEIERNTAIHNYLYLDPTGMGFDTLYATILKALEEGWVVDFRLRPSHEENAMVAEYNTVAYIVAPFQ